MSNNSSVSNIWKVTTLAAGLLFVISGQVKASAFALHEQSITYLGNAYAGTSSAAQDASSSYYNPAVMSELEHSQIVLSSAYIVPEIKLYSTYAANSAGQVITGNNPGKSNKSMVVGGGHVAWRVTKDATLALSVVRPFGMNIVYGSGDIVRLMATTSKISTIDISPTVAYKFNRDFSVGAGLDILKVRSTIASGVAWGNVGEEANGYVINKGKGTSIGYHVGILFKPWCKANMGLVYFSHFNPRISGSTTSYQTQDFFSTSSFNLKMKLPDRVNYSVTQKFSEEFSTMGEVEWTHWSRLKTFAINYNSSATSGKQSFYFKNTWRLALGVDYKFMPKWTIKGGVGYDQSPTNNTFRSANMPDTDSYMLAFGLKYMLNKSLALQAGYAHVFFRNANISETGATNALNLSQGAVNASRLNASVKKYTNIVGLQLVLNLAR